MPGLGVLLLLYLTVFPLFFLVLGSFQEEVRPREFVYTLDNYAQAYPSRFTYSTAQFQLDAFTLDRWKVLASAEVWESVKNTLIVGFVSATLGVLLVSLKVVHIGGILGTSGHLRASVDPLFRRAQPSDSLSAAERTGAF